MSKGIGIIGCGKIAQVRHIPEFDRNPDATIIGYYNPTRSRAEQMAARYGGKVYDDIPSLLADPACALQWIRRDGTVERLDVEPIQTNDNQTASGVADAFLEALSTRNEGVMSARRVLPAMRAVFAAIQSSEQGRYVEIS